MSSPLSAHFVHNEKFCKPIKAVAVAEAEDLKKPASCLQPQAFGRPSKPQPESNVTATELLDGSGIVTSTHTHNTHTIANTRTHARTHTHTHNTHTIANTGLLFPTSASLAL